MIDNPIEELKGFLGLKVLTRQYLSCLCNIRGWMTLSQQRLPFSSIGVALKPRPAHLSEAVLKGYLRMIFYDKQNQYLDEQTYYVESTTCQPLGVKPGTQEAREVTVQQEGYVRVFVANESDVPVWFDDLEVSLERGLLVQENHYDPWGLNLAGIEKQGNPDHKFQYNGKEKQEELGLNWLDYGARMYDPQLGRWHAVDPLARKYSSLSPYNYVGNSPLILKDPNGKEIIITYVDSDGNTRTITYKANMKTPAGASNFLNKTIQSLNTIYKNAANERYKIKDLINQKAKVNIVETKKFGDTKFVGNGPLGGDIKFNAYQAEDYGGNNGKQSPTVGLAHELDHAWKHNTIVEEYNQSKQQSDLDRLLDFETMENGSAGRNAEENRAVGGLERQVSQALNQYSRTEYTPPQKVYATDEVNSTIMQKNVDPVIQKNIDEYNRAIQGTEKRDGF